MSVGKKDLLYGLPEGKVSEELEVVDVGFEKCKPLHKYGPHIRDHFLFHFPTGGKGTFEVGGNKYSVGAGQCFIIRPDELTVYCADENEPWTYVWLGFRGKSAARLVETAVGSASVAEIGVDFARELAEYVERSASRRDKSSISVTLALTAQCYRMLSELAECGDARTVRPDVVRSAVRFMESNYFHSFDIAWLAKKLGISRTHFTMLFTESVGLSPHAYLTDVRLSRAAKLLTGSDLSVGEIASAVGYKSVERFSAAFSSRYSISPLRWRKSNDSTERQNQSTDKV